MRLLHQLMMALAIIIQASTDGAAGNRVAVKMGDNVTLACVDLSEEEQLESLFWYKEDILQASVGSKKEVRFVEDSPERKGISGEEGDYSLTLWGLEVGDTATYTCKVYVLNYTQMENLSVSWELVVQDVPSPPGQAVLEAIESRQATVKWLASSKDNNSPISNYIVQIRECNSNTTARELVTGGTTYQISMQKLDPGTCYTARVLARNSMGPSTAGLQSDPFHTRAEIPTGAPEDFQAVSTSSSDIHLTWRPPRPHSLNGELQGYKVIFFVNELDTQTVPVDDPTTTELTLHGLSPFTWYTVSILAYNSEGDGPKAVKAVQTLQGVPSSPRITHTTEREATSFFVHWEPPKVLNGHLKSYELRWMLHDVSKKRIISGLLTNPMSAFITDLRPYTEYKVQVAAITEGGRGNFSEKYPALTDVAAPGAPNILNVTVLSPTRVRVQWEPPSIVYKKVDYYVFKWWDTHGNDPYVQVPGTRTEYILRDLPSNRRYSLKMAGMTKAIFNKRYLVGDFTEPVTFTLTEEEKSQPIEEENTQSLDPKYAESKEEKVPTEIIAGVTCAIVVMLIIVVMFIGYRSLACQKCYQAAYFYLAVPNHLQSTPPTVVTVAEPSEEKEYPEIPVGEFSAHVEAMHADGDFAFSQDFEDLYRNTRTDFTCEASNMPDNRDKNRYINIAAFDHSRVVLKMDSGRPKQSDYINANYVDGYQKHKSYIATQGPLPQTFPDFWRMVWEQNCCVIVMITNLMEKGRRKCDPYWPNEGTEVYGNVSVKLVSAVQRAHYTVRTFSLRNMKVKKKHSVKGASERTVYQYHYTEWPDHGVPDYTLPVLEFVQKSAACNPLDGGPIIVHCSAGVGRTGTYILIDSMIRQMAEKGTVNIPGFTLHIRRQRNLLVQTEDQYMFIHDVLVEYLMGGGQTEVKEDNLLTFVASLTSSANGVMRLSSSQLAPSDSPTTLEKQLKMVTSHTPGEQDMSCALKPVNLEKNQSEALLPVNLKRVVLPARPGVEGSEYINATYLHGYKKSDEFIVTQYPLDFTKEDLWRMVWDRNSPVIIVLLSPDDEEPPHFWPERGEVVEVDSSNFKLSMREEPEETPTYTTRHFILESMQYDYIFMTKVVTVREWPDTFPVQYSVFTMVETAMEWQRTNDIGPTILMDKYGGARTGRFCALWALRDQLMLDRLVDVYQLAKLYHLKRPGIIGSQDDLRFLYEALACLKEHHSTLFHHHHHHQHPLTSPSSPSSPHYSPPHSPLHRNGGATTALLPRSSSSSSCQQNSATSSTPTMPIAPTPPATPTFPTAAAEAEMDI